MWLHLWPLRANIRQVPDRPKALFRKTVSRMPALRAQVPQ